MNRLKDLRSARGLTVREVSDMTGIVFSTISALETGKRKMNAHHAKLLAPVFGVSESFIIGDDNFEVAPDIKSFFEGVWADMFDDVVSGAMAGTLDDKSRLMYVVFDRILHGDLNTVQLKYLLEVVDKLIDEHKGDIK